MVPEGNLAFMQPEDAVDDPFQHTQRIHRHQKHIFHDNFPLWIVFLLINDLSYNQRCQKGIWSLGSLKMRLTTSSSNSEHHENIFEVVQYEFELSWLLTWQKNPFKQHFWCHSLFLKNGQKWQKNGIFAYSRYG